MSSVSLYYGAPVTNAQQKVSEAVRLRGLNLIKSSPAKVEPQGIRLIVSPSYDIYTENLHLAIHSAHSLQAVPMCEETLFVPFQSKRNLPFCERFRVVWDTVDVDPQPDQTALDAMRTRYQPAEIAIYGKPAFIADLNITQIASLIKCGVRRTTPTVSGSVNLAAALGAIKISRLAMAFLTTHQYPLSSGDDSHDSIFRKAFAMEMDSIDAEEIDFPDDSGMNVKKEFYQFSKPNPSSYVFHMNGLTNPANFNPFIGSKTSLPNLPGFLFPFVKDLAREDNESLVPRVIEDYFFNCLGNNKEVATQVLDNLKAGWGNIKSTEMGDHLAHLFSGIRLAITTGAALKIIYGTSYDGFHLGGTNFNLYFQNNLLAPASFQEIQDEFDGSLPHTISLQRIINRINFPDEATKAARTQSIHSLHVLRGLLMEFGYSTIHDQEIRQSALHLTFPAQPFLAINAHNVSLLLKAMTQSDSADIGFPLNPLYLLSSNRKHRLWSAFGQYGPTFLIPGGKVISLTSNQFSYTQKNKATKVKTEHVVTRMHIQIVPIEKAIADLDTVLTKKDVHSPVGTPMARKASSVSLFREFAGPAASEVLASLRIAAGVVISAGTTRGQKRAAEDAAGGDSNRRRFAGLMEDL